MPKQRTIQSNTGKGAIQAPRGAATVQSVEAAVKILGLIAERGGPARVMDLARELDMTKAKISRHLQTLAKLGMVERATPDGYAFGHRMIQLGEAAIGSRSIATLARAHLEQLTAATGHTTLISLPVAGGSVVSDCVSRRSGVVIFVPPGTLLAYPHSPAARIAQAYRQPLPSQRGQPASCEKPDEPVVRCLSRLRQFGVDFEPDPHRTGLGAMAVPILGPESQLMGVVSLVMPSSLFREIPSGDLLDAIQHCVQGIERDLGTASLAGAAVPRDS